MAPGMGPVRDSDATTYRASEAIAEKDNECLRTVLYGIGDQGRESRAHMMISSLPDTDPIIGTTEYVSESVVTKKNARMLANDSVLVIPVIAHKSGAHLWELSLPGAGFRPRGYRQSGGLCFRNCQTLKRGSKHQRMTLEGVWA